MLAKRYFSYIRVSTARQGQHGTSLAEQQSAIEFYARRLNLPIVKQYEERESASTAANRRVFLEMVKALRQGRAGGVIVHKIDRSARNLHEWADFSSLSDEGFDVHFAHETFDLKTRGGRLSADIVAVVAADYSRNLREETKKGLYGRLKQGLFPFPAPAGYLNKGKAKPKEPDPVQAPLVRKAFELYATGEWGLIALADYLYERGLRNKNGRKITINGLASILHNPFYTGLVKIEKTGELFAGVHEPLVAKRLFDEVQAVFARRNVKKTKRHFFIFRQHVVCARCRSLLIPEKQKGYRYYRCHTRHCLRGTFREEALEKSLIETCEQLRFSPAENRLLRRAVAREEMQIAASIEQQRQVLTLRKEQIGERLSRLADAYMDAVFDRETYLEKKNALVSEEQEVKEKMSNLPQNAGEVARRLDAFLELVNSADLSYQSGSPEEKRDLVKTLSSNFLAEEKKVSIKLNLPFQLVAERSSFTFGRPYREASRTLNQLAKKLLLYFKTQCTAKNAANVVEAGLPLRP